MTQKNDDNDTMPLPDKLSAGLRPRTWTGRIVSWQEWAKMTDKERFGKEIGNNGVQAGTIR